MLIGACGATLVAGCVPERSARPGRTAEGPTPLNSTSADTAGAPDHRLRAAQPASMKFTFASSRDPQSQTFRFTDGRETVMRVEQEAADSSKSIYWVLLGKSVGDHTTSTTDWTINNNEAIFHIKHGWGYFTGTWPTTPAHAPAALRRDMAPPIWPVVRTKRIKVYASGTSFIVQVVKVEQATKHRVFFVCPAIREHLLKIGVIDNSGNEGALLTLQSEQPVGAVQNTQDTFNVGDEFWYVEVDETDNAINNTNAYVKKLADNNDALMFVNAIKDRVKGKQDSFNLDWNCQGP